MEGIQGTAAHVEDGAGVDARHFPARAVHAPTEVNLFHVRKQGFVQTSGRLKGGRAHHQTGAGSPKNGTNGRFAVLTGIHFAGVKHAAKGIRVGEEVHAAAGGAGVFKAIRIRVAPQHRLRGAQAWVGGKGSLQRRPPEGQGLNVRIHQDGQLQSRPLGAQLAQGGVVAAGVSAVLVHGQEVHARVVRRHVGGRIIGGAVVRHHQGHGFRGGGFHSGQEPLQPSAAVPVQYHHGVAHGVLNAHRCHCP